MIKKLIRRILGVGSGAGAATQPKIFGPEEHGIDPDDVSPNAVRVTQNLQ